MRNFTRLYAEGGDIVSKFYPSGPTGSAGTSMLEGLTGGPGDKKKKCKGGKCAVRQPRSGRSAFAAPGMGGRKKARFKGRH
jgi:hypothetical protein